MAENRRKIQRTGAVEMIARVLTNFVLCARLLTAQEVSKVEYACPEDDLQDFGLICSEDEPCRVFLELAAVEASGATAFLTGNLHTDQTTLFGILLASEDGGKTWTEPAKRLRSSMLDQIQFADFQHGWISGVKLEPLPRDPFLLATADGGKTWRSRPMFEDTRFGSIQQFWFDSAQTGELILDRSQGSTKSYEFYDTQTGGDTWNIKEATNKQPRLTKARPRENPTWRLRADAAAKAYRVEKRTATASGERWETIASFSVLAGECK